MVVDDTLVLRNNQTI